MTLPLTYRLKCKLSYCDEETGELRCRSGCACDGTAYFEPCQPERCVYDEDCPCCWPIDECDDCPNHPCNYDPYWGPYKGANNLTSLSLLPPGRPASAE